MKYKVQLKIKYQKADPDEEKIIGEFDTKKEAEIWCENEGVDYDYYSIIKVI